MSDPTTVDAAIADALEAYASLGELGEEVDDEWTYVTELGTAWRERLESVADARAGETLDPAAAAAIETLIDQIARIDDPHRAIDWLSTFPQVVLLAFGEPA
jgi:hypothetical protein